jgi:hypothetical protein
MEEGKETGWDGKREFSVTGEGEEPPLSHGPQATDGRRRGGGG